MPIKGIRSIPDLEFFIQEAIKDALKGGDKGEVPVGALITDRSGEILARDHNRCISLNDPTAHAEILVLREAALRKNNYRLPNTVLYVTLEPCLMCIGAILQARVATVVFGVSDPKAGACGSFYSIPATPGIMHKIKVVTGVLEKECREILQAFFKTKRQ